MSAKVSLDPYYVHIGREEFAQLLGRSKSQLDKLRKEHPDCPKGFKTGSDKLAKVMFRLSEAYAFSDTLIAESMERTKAEEKREQLEEE